MNKNSKRFCRPIDERKFQARAILRRPCISFYALKSITGGTNPISSHQWWLFQTWNLRHKRCCIFAFPAPKRSTVPSLDWKISHALPWIVSICFSGSTLWKLLVELSINTKFYMQLHILFYKNTFILFFSHKYNENTLSGFQKLYYLVKYSNFIFF